MRSAKAMLLLTLSATILTACDKTRSIGTVPPVIGSTGVYCAKDRRQTFSATRDTPETIAQIRRANAEWEATCLPMQSGDS